MYLLISSTATQNAIRVSNSTLALVKHAVARFSLKNKRILEVMVRYRFDNFGMQITQQHTLISLIL